MLNKKRKPTKPKSLLALAQSQEEELVAAATDLIAPELKSFDQAIERVQAMLDIAQRNERKADARVNRLVEWIRQNLLVDARSWNERRLIVFTEWEDTRLWLEKRLQEAFADTDRADERIATFTGITGQKRREQVKLAFNTDPKREPLRILLCTDAAREGINLQTWCHDLVHFDLPWNPSRVEQRNGRIDRKLQPADVVTCRYFVYRQRLEDRVLEALVRKTETIRNQLGSAGQVLAERIHQRLSQGGIAKTNADTLASEIDAEQGNELVQRASREMSDEIERRLNRLAHDLELLDSELDRARDRVGIEPSDLQTVVQTALGRDGVPLSAASDASVDHAFRIDPTSPAFANDSTWGDLFDELRKGRPPQQRKAAAEWRAKTPVRAVAFTAPVLPDGRDAEDVVHLHIEHRLVRRLLSRFVSQGFKAGLSRASVIYGPGTQPRVVLVGRLALYGPAAARLHEEILPITAFWSEAARQRGGLRALGEAGEQTTMAELEVALNSNAVPPQDVVDRLMAGAQDDVRALRPALEQRAKAAGEIAQRELATIARREAEALRALLTSQRDRIKKEAATDDSAQLQLDLADPAERRQREADRRRWDRRLAEIERELAEEPERVAKSYEIRAERLEPVGILYLWPRRP
jgi:hypothetical protein